MDNSHFSLRNESFDHRGDGLDVADPVVLQQGVDGPAAVAIEMDAGVPVGYAAAPDRRVGDPVDVDRPVAARDLAVHDGQYVADVAAVDVERIPDALE